MREVKGTLAAIKDDSQVFPEPGEAGVKGKREKRTAKAEARLMEISGQTPSPRLPGSRAGLSPLPYFSFDLNRLLLDPTPLFVCIYSTLELTQNIYSKFLRKSSDFRRFPARPAKFPRSLPTGRCPPPRVKTSTGFHPPGNVPRGLTENMNRHRQ